MKKLIALAFIMVLALSLFTACGGGSDEENIVGVWIWNDGVQALGAMGSYGYEFLEDGTGSRYSGLYKDALTWNIEDGRLYTSIETFDYELKRSKSTITVITSDGSSGRVLVKQ